MYYQHRRVLFNPTHTHPLPQNSTPMIIKITPQELKKGMYIVNTGLSWIDNPYLYSEEGEIRSEKIIQKVAGEGYREVFVDTEKGSYVFAHSGPDDSATQAKSAPRGPQPSRPKNTRGLKDESLVAKKIYSDSIQFAKEFMSDARLGKQVNYPRAELFVEEIIDSVTRNSDAMLSLTKLRRYDEYTFTHCINVSVISLAFGKYLGLPEQDMRLLGSAALFHDLGKALIPSNVLNKPAKLTDEEFEIIKKHPAIGYAMLKDQKGVHKSVLRGILEHHEKCNGRGYPIGLPQDSISELALIISLSDVYDALTSERVYKKGMPANKALSIIFGMRERDYYPEIVEKFIKCLGIYPVGSFVRVSNGQYAVILTSNAAMPLKPCLKIILSSEGQPIAPVTVDLDDADSPLATGLEIVACEDAAAFGVRPEDHF